MDPLPARLAQASLSTSQPVDAAAVVRDVRPVGLRGVSKRLRGRSSARVSRGRYARGDEEGRDSRAVQRSALGGRTAGSRVGRGVVRTARRSEKAGEG